MNIDKYINDTIMFYINLNVKTIQSQNKQYIVNILFDFILNKNGQFFILKHPKLHSVIKLKCKEFLNDPELLPMFLEKMKLYDNILSELDISV